MEAGGDQQPLGLGLRGERREGRAQSVFRAVERFSTTSQRWARAIGVVKAHRMQRQQGP